MQVQQNFAKLYGQKQTKQICSIKNSYFDILLVLNGQIFPLQFNVIEKCQYLKKNIRLSEKVHFMDTKFQIVTITKIFNFFNGVPLQFKRNHQIFQILEIIEFFQIQILRQKLHEQMRENYEQYGIILLFKIARKCRYQWLQKFCLQKLVQSKFLQFQINKFDLLNADVEIFLQMVKHYQIFKQKGMAIEFNQDKMKQLIDDYSTMNSINIDQKQVLSISPEDKQKLQKLLEKQFPQKNQQNLLNKPIRRNKTISYSKNSQMQRIQFLEQNRVKQNYSSSKKVKRLKQTNMMIKRQTQNMSNQIRQLKQKINMINTEQNHAKNLISNFQSISQKLDNQKQRFNNIQNSIKRLV